MRLDEGNIFEAMRLVLPEHRAVMRFVTQQRAKRGRPVLTEDQMNEMQYKLSEALEEQLPVRLSLFHPHEDVILEGLLSLEGNTLVMYTTDEKKVRLPIRDIIGIENL